jgi:hypothetical protein
MVAEERNRQSPRRDLPVFTVDLAMSRLMLKSAKRASLIENLRSLRGLGKMRVR